MKELFVCVLEDSVPFMKRALLQRILCAYFTSFFFFFYIPEITAVHCKSFFSLHTGGILNISKWPSANSYGLIICSLALSAILVSLCLNLCGSIAEFCQK